MTPFQYLSAGLGVALAVVGAALWLTFNRLDACHADRATEKARYESKLAEFDQKLRDQNKAIEEWQKAATTATQAGKAALEKARMEGRSLAAEHDRLKALAGKLVPSNCPAGVAVQQIRKGLGAP